MANVGVTKMYAAKYAVGNGGITYSDGIEIAQATKIGIELNDGGAVKFYANNALRESAKQFTGGTLTVGADDLSVTCAAFIYGLTAAASSTGGATNMLVYKDSVVPPYLGYGTVLTKIVGGTAKYVGLFLHKVQFNLDALDRDTRGETIEFTAQELTADIMLDDDTDPAWKTTAEFTAEADADTWVKTKLGIS